MTTPPRLTRGDQPLHFGGSGKAKASSGPMAGASKQLALYV